MDETRVQQLNSTNVNLFANAAEFMAAADRTVVRPNVDTLYSTAWLDFTHEPMVMSVPETGGRYYEMQMLDAWTNTFAAPGKRTTGTTARNFLLLGPENRDAHVLCNHDKALQPDFRSDFVKIRTARSDLTCIDAPTSTVFVLGRTQTNGVSDYDAVHAVQAGFKITPLSKWLEGGDGDSPTSDITAVWKKAPDAADDLAATPTPPSVIASLDAEQFFLRATTLLSTTSQPSAADAPLIKSLCALGIAPGSDFNFTSLAKPVQRALSRAVELGNRKVQGLPAAAAKAQKPGWAAPNTKIGNYGTSYELRESISVLGLFANIAKDAIYINLESLPESRVTDPNPDSGSATYTEAGTATAAATGSGSGSGSEPLTADRTYALTFPKGALPPVGAFWSITLYDTAGYLIPNSIGRYALHSWDHLIPDSNGSTTIVISAKPPAPEPGFEFEQESASTSSTGTSNWLPAPTDGKRTTEFQLTARFYWPGDEIASGEWEMPSLSQVREVAAAGVATSTESATEPAAEPMQTTQTSLVEKDQISEDNVVIGAGAPSDDSDSGSSSTVVVVVTVAAGVACLAAVAVAMIAFRNTGRRGKRKNNKRQPILSLDSSEAEQQYTGLGEAESTWAASRGVGGVGWGQTSFRPLETPQTIPITAGPARSNSVVLAEKYMEL